MHTHWHYLAPGDMIEIIAPGYGCSPEMLVAVREAIEQLGFRAHIPKNLLGDDPFCSHNDDERLGHLHAALMNPESKALWCIRGGYGSARLIPPLATLPVNSRAKLLIGFSDITALHLFFTQHYGWPTLHAEVLLRLVGKPGGERGLAEIRDILLGEEKQVAFNLLPLNEAALKAGTVTSSVTGGNLSLIQTSIATGWQLKGKGKILMIEEVDERGYRIDRMLEHCMQAGIIEGIDALIIGDMIGGEERDGRPLGEIALRRFAEALPVPVLKCPGIGHGAINRPLPFGAPAVLALGKQPTLTCETGGRP